MDGPLPALPGAKHMADAGAPPPAQTSAECFCQGLGRGRCTARPQRQNHADADLRTDATLRESEARCVKRADENPVVIRASARLPAAGAIARRPERSDPHLLRAAAGCALNANTALAVAVRVPQLLIWITNISTMTSSVASSGDDARAALHDCHRRRRRLAGRAGAAKPASRYRRQMAHRFDRGRRLCALRTAGVDRALGYRTPNGTYRPQWLARKWFSRKYDWSPMPYSIFFDGGYAIHGSYEISHLGAPALMADPPASVNAPAVRVGEEQMGDTPTSSPASAVTTIARADIDMSGHAARSRANVRRTLRLSLSDVAELERSLAAQWRRRRERRPVLWLGALATTFSIDGIDASLRDVSAMLLKMSEEYVSCRAHRNCLSALQRAGSISLLAHTSTFNAAMNASCGMSTLPNCRMRFLPSFCLSSSLRLRVASPP